DKTEVEHISAQILLRAHDCLHLHQRTVREKREAPLAMERSDRKIADAHRGAAAFTGDGGLLFGEGPDESLVGTLPWIVEKHIPYAHLRRAPWRVFARAHGQAHD